MSSTLLLFLKTRLNGALESQLSLAVANVKRLRRVHPDKTLAELIAYMDKFYFGAAVIAGATQGAAAAGANTAMQAAVVDLPASFEVSVLYALSVAGIHGLDPEDIERRTLLMLVALVEDFFGTVTMEPLIGRTAPHGQRRLFRRSGCR